MLRIAMLCCKHGIVCIPPFFASARTKVLLSYVGLLSSRAQALDKVGRNSSRRETLGVRSKP